jgi:hypothetical protein
MLHTLFLACLVAGVIWFLATPLRTGLWRFPGPWWRRYTGSQGLLFGFLRFKV